MIVNIDLSNIFVDGKNVINSGNYNDVDSEQWAYLYVWVCRVLNLLDSSYSVN